MANRTVYDYHYNYCSRCEQLGQIKTRVSPQTVDGGQQQFIMTQTAEDQRRVQAQILDQHLHPVAAEQLLNTSRARQSPHDRTTAPRDSRTTRLTFLCMSPSQRTDRTS